MAFALPAIASAVAAAAPAAAAAATKVSLMAIAKSVLMNVAINAAMSALQPQVGSAGRTYEWTLDPNAPIPFAAGRVGVAGTVVHLDTYGPDKMYYGFVSILSGAGPVKAITGFKGDDEVVTFDAGGKAISSQWAGEMWLRSRLGTQPDTALTNPTGLKNNAQLPSWTAAHKLSGKACYMLVLGENSKRSAYPTGEPKPLVTVEGLFGWDPRKDSTYPGGVGTCRLNDPSTWVWLDNPILWGLKWALGLWEGPIGKGAPGVDYQVGGIGATVDGIKVERFVAAANVADANGWKVAAYPTTDDDKSQVLDSFLQAGGAIYAQEQGKISCIQRAAPRASAITITAADTAGPLEIDTAATRIDRINTIRPRFWSEAHRWQMTAIDDVTAEAYRVEDGAVRPRGIDFAYVPLATQAAQLAALQIANTREGIAGTIPLKPHLRNIAPGTAFTITEPGFLLDGLKCLCLNSDYDPLTGVVSVTFVSETDAKYPFALGQSPIPPAPPVLTPPVTTVTPPQAGEWVLTSELLTDNGATVPALVLTGEVDNARAQSVIFEFQPVDPDNPTAPWADLWTGAGTEDPTVERKEITGLTPTPYWAAVSYRVAGNISARLVLGPVTAGSVVTPPVPAPITVPGVPAIAVGTMIAADGTEITTLSGSWTVLGNASSYDIDIDDGTAIWTESSPVAAIKNLRIVTGRSYRIRIKAVNRDGVRSPAYSVWSATVAAGGDVTAPGPTTGGAAVAGPRSIFVTWVNPTDADFSHIRLVRSTSPTVIGATVVASNTSATGFVDYDVTVGVLYYYFSFSVDRSGNETPAATFIGQATARYITTGGGDVSPTDPTLVTSVGTSALVFGQTAWATSPLPTSRLNYLDNAGNLDSLSRVTSRGLGLLTGRTADNITYLTGGATVDSLRPGEAGANVTESRTAALVAGQGSLATRNNVTAAMMPLLSSENDFTDEDFDSTLVTLASGATFDTSAETTGTMGIKRSIKSPVGNGSLAPSQAQLNGLSTTNLIPVTPGQSVRFNVRSLVKAGFTGLLRSFRYFVGPTGTTIGGATIDTIVDRRGAAQAVTTVYETEAAPLTVPAGASHCYFVFFVDWSGSQANAGYALVGKPRLRRIADFGGLASDAVRLGSSGNVRQSNGTTQVTDATAITAMGVAALVAGQSILATLNIPQYASNAAAVAANAPNGSGYYNTTAGRLDTVIRSLGDGVGAIFATPSLSTVVGGNSAVWAVWDSKDVAGVPASATIDPLTEVTGAGTTATPSASANFNIRLTEQLVSGGVETVVSEGSVSIVSSDLDLGGGSYQVSASGGFSTRYIAATKSGNVRYRLYYQGFAGNDPSIGAYFSAILRIYS